MKSHWQDEARSEMIHFIQPRTVAQGRRIMIQSRTIQDQSTRIKAQSERILELEEQTTAQAVEIRGIREKVADFEIQLLDSSGKQDVSWISRTWMGIEGRGGLGAGVEEADPRKRSSSVASLEEGEIRVKEELFKEENRFLFDRHTGLTIGDIGEEVNSGINRDEDLGGGKRRRV